MATKQTKIAWKSIFATFLQLCLLVSALATITYVEALRQQPTNFLLVFLALALFSPVFPDIVEAVQGVVAVIGGTLTALERQLGRLSRALRFSGTPALTVFRLGIGGLLLAVVVSGLPVGTLRQNVGFAFAYIVLPKRNALRELAAAVAGMIVTMSILAWAQVKDRAGRAMNYVEAQRERKADLEGDELADEAQEMLEQQEPITAQGESEGQGEAELRDEEPQSEETEVSDL